MNQQLHDYITQSRKAGKADDQIRQELLNAGWKEVEINEILFLESQSMTTIKTKVLATILATISCIVFIFLIISMIRIPFSFDVSDQLSFIIPVLLLFGVIALWLFSIINIWKYNKLKIYTLNRFKILDSIMWVIISLIPYSAFSLFFGVIKGSCDWLGFVKVMGPPGQECYWIDTLLDYKAPSLLLTTTIIFIVFRLFKIWKKPDRISSNKLP